MQSIYSIVVLCMKAIALRLGVRERYIFTLTGRPKLRHIATLALLTGTAISGVLQEFTSWGNGFDSRTAQVPFLSTQDFVLTESQGTANPISLSAVTPHMISASARANSTEPAVFAFEPKAALEGIKTVNSFAMLRPAIPLGPQVVTIRKGDTLDGALRTAGLDPNQAREAAQAARKHIDLRKIKAGQTLELRMEYSQGWDAPGRLVEASMPIDSVRTVVLQGSDDGGVAAQLYKVPVQEMQKISGGTINGSLYGAARAAGLPVSMVGNLIRIYSWDVDFQRDIQPGDRFEVLYTVRQTQAGAVVETGDILYAALHTRGKTLRMYRFEDSDGRVAYFGPDGKGAKKALMRTPVDGARISSAFGMRRHPILGYSKMHKGMDFAAPSGTPIYAAGDGTIEKASRFSGYGNYICIKHAGGMKTAYGHLSRYAKGIHPGVRVEQGEVIGYVGTTGRSTGPHLHYEVVVNGKQVNPAKVKQAMGGNLAGADLKRFKANVSSLDQKYAALAKNAPTRVAAR